MERDEVLLKGFFNERRFLSNMYPVKIEFEGIIYPSVENAYQASKTTDKGVRKQIAVVTPKESKELGKVVELRDYWSEIKEAIMFTLVKTKFTENETLKQKLLETGEEELIEYNYWGDTFWGVYNGKGENKLGQILMFVRSSFFEDEVFE